MSTGGLRQRHVANGRHVENSATQHKRSTSLLGNLHSHSHGNADDDIDESNEHSEAGMILDALSGRGDEGSWVTLVGLLSNVALVALKGFAGWYLNSAALIADAGHSLSDLMGDIVTLFCWTLSQRPPSSSYPYGYGKFESLGTTAVAVLLLLGGVGVGMHSWSLLAETLAPLVQSPTGMLLVDENSILYTIIRFLFPTPNPIPDVTSSINSSTHLHDTADTTPALSATALYFPLLGILIKEYLYRLTKRVADRTSSSVLMANALHHRSDAYSSIVTVVAIVGSIIFPRVPVDPMGGLLVAALIFGSGVKIFKGALGELTDVSVSDSLIRTYNRVLKDEVDSKEGERMARTGQIKAVRSGSKVIVDVILILRPSNENGEPLVGVDVVDAIQKVKRRIQSVRQEVMKVNVEVMLEA